MCVPERFNKDCCLWVHGKSGFEYIINGFAKPRAGYDKGGTDVGPELGKSVLYFGKIENLSLFSENLCCFEA